MVIVSAERWTDLIEQTTMLMMILGRWLLPTVQGMTKDSLSQLLLINLAVCADIIEFFDLLKLGFVKNTKTGTGSRHAEAVDVFQAAPHNFVTKRCFSAFNSYEFQAKS